MKAPKDYIIFPLDVPSIEAAARYVKLLSGSVGMFKVGLELFIESGPDIIRMIRETGGARIFLDLKLHDIPETVSRAVDRIAALNVDFATVHCGESSRMLEAAVSAGRNRVGVLGVTVLTSVSSGDIRAAGFKDDMYADMSALVIKRAAMAKAAGCAGVVCSGLEVRMIKDRFGSDFIAVTPGIRPVGEGMPADDQKRVTTPAEAIRNGADFLVIGRPIRDASDPKGAAVRIAEEIAEAI